MEGLSYSLDLNRVDKESVSHQKLLLYSYSYIEYLKFNESIVNFHTYTTTNLLFTMIGYN